MKTKIILDFLCFFRPSYLHSLAYEEMWSTTISTTIIITTTTITIIITTIIIMSMRI